jgi:diguanylate cyclase (GGDEF)-like protein/PAS domain S-box-containing protein
MHSLQLRFMAMVIAGASVFAALAGAFAYQMGHARALRSGSATIGGLVDAVEKTAAIGAFSGDRVLLQEVIDGLAGNPLVARVEVRAAAGDLLVQRGAAAATGSDNAAAIRVDRRLASPFDKAEAVGMLHIEADASRMEADARSGALQFAGLMVGQTALVALLLYVAAERLVTRPIVRLGRSLRMLEPGTSQRLQTPPRHAQDEIGALIASANTLLEGNELALQRERELRAAIEKMEAQYRQIFDSSSAGIFVLDPQGRLINSNPTALRIIGVPATEMKLLQGSDFVRRAFARPERVLSLLHDATERGETVSADLELLQPDALPRWVHCLISVQSRAPQGALIEGVMYDITERKRVEHDVRHLAEHDALTGLKNRATGHAAIDRFISDAQVAHSAVTLLYIDLDGFKQVNDGMGHKAGDLVLVQCALRLQTAVRRVSDVVCRVGGDEFVIALHNTGCGDAAASAIASAVLVALQEPVVLDDGREARVGASIGMACYPRHGVTRRQLLTAADAAMYEVKRSGKNSYAAAVAALPMA